MKKIFSIMLVSAAATSALFTSCLDLDSDKYFDDRSTLESVFSSRTQSEEWLAYAFSFLTGVNAEVSSKGSTGGTGGGWNPFCFADDMYYGDRDNTYGDSKDGSWASYQSFRQGLYSEENGTSAWNNCYRGINQASLFIHNIDKNTEMTSKEIEDYRGQARFLRAYYYWLLLRKFGPVPIMPDDGADYSASYEDLSIPRSSYEEVAEYISEQMIQAAKEIACNRSTNEAHRDETNFCRPTVGACLATRAIAYIYAASPLANGQKGNGAHNWNSLVTDNAAHELINKDGKKLLTWEYDESKWARAAAACKDVMELQAYRLYASNATTTGDALRLPTIPCYEDGDFSTRAWNITYDYANADPASWGYNNIDPLRSYADLFNGVTTPYYIEEVIFSRGVNGGNTNNDFGIGAMVYHAMPQTALHGWNTHGMTQKMCDAYYMKDGSDCPGKDSEELGTGEERAQGWTLGREPKKTDKKYKDNLELWLADYKTYVGARENPDDPESPLLYPEMYNQYKEAQSLSNVSFQYVGREPRFYASVAFSGCRWEQRLNTVSSDQNKQIFYYRGGGDGYINNFSYLRTGIGIKKWYNPNDYRQNQNDVSHISDKYETAIRYADILLMYAEAINELTSSYSVKSWDGTKTYTIARDVNELKKGVRPVRARAGVPDYNDDVYADVITFREKLKRERMIELMGEGKRYFDLRRWMDAPVEESRFIYGLNVFETEKNRDEFMKVIPTYNLQTAFSDKMYFWPIAHSELKRNKNLVQNPGWTYND